ncbi:helix-turn-helix domain-containing protein [Sphingomonas sp.]|uniref:helix-turn-helix domain-containing protein n=1 Tax=Sphingomonas sp. TaxID=28214 RepID=UPI003B00F921
MRDIPISGRMFYSPDEIAGFLGVHRSTVDRWSREGKLIAPEKVGSRVLYSVADFEAWAANPSKKAA